MISAVEMVLQLCRAMTLFSEVPIKIFWGEMLDICNVLSNVAEKNNIKTNMAKFQQLLNFSGIDILFFHLWIIFENFYHKEFEKKKS